MHYYWLQNVGGQLIEFQITSHGDLIYSCQICHDLVQEKNVVDETQASLVYTQRQGKCDKCLAHKFLFS